MSAIHLGTGEANPLSAARHLGHGDFYEIVHGDFYEDIVHHGDFYEINLMVRSHVRFCTDPTLLLLPDHNFRLDDVATHGARREPRGWGHVLLLIPIIRTTHPLITAVASRGGWGLAP